MKIVPNLLVFGFLGLVVTTSVLAETEGERNFRKNKEAADAVSKRNEAEKSKEQMRDKTHDGYNRYKTTPDSSVGINPTKNNDGAIIDYTIKTK